jgi:TorA maturation chaperone TorD
VISSSIFTTQPKIWQIIQVDDAMNHSEVERLVSAAVHLSPEDQARADLYALSAHLLLAAPDAAFLAGLAAADSLPSQQADNPLDRAWEKLVLAATLTTADQVQQEFSALFIGTGTPRLNPHASLYLTGSMMDQPLAAIRATLAELGLARIPGAGELEDHLAALCETMRLLITDQQDGEPLSLPLQKSFFEKHLASWYGRCLEDIRKAEGASFYQPVADFIQAFLDIEAAAFQIEDPGTAKET